MEIKWRKAVDILDRGLKGVFGVAIAAKRTPPPPKQQKDVNLGGIY